MARSSSIATAAALGLTGCNLVFGLGEVTPPGPPKFEEVTVTLETRPTDLAIGDIDLDDRLDVVVAAGAETVLELRNGVGTNGDFEMTLAKLAFEAARQFVTIALVPQPGGTPPDLLLLDPAGTAYRVANAGGIFGTASVIWTGFGAPPGSDLLIARLEPPDIDAATVLVATPGLRPVAAHHMEAAIDYMLTGAITPTAFVAWTTARLNATEPSDLVIVDDDAVGLYLGTHVMGAFGPFGDPVQTFGDLGRPIAAGTLDADEPGDVVARLRGAPAVMALFGDGNGGVLEQTRIDLEFAPSAIAVIDLDADGGGDVCAAGSLGADTVVQCARSSADRTFTVAPRLEVHGQLVKMVAADFDRDGKDDLALLLETSATTGEVRFLLQR